ncbi:MAG: TolC family protein [Campylobacterota bacterium]|nr:TolC family protein [Campylobacterota bacterium]
MKKIISILFVSYPLFAISLPELVRIGLKESTVVKKSQTQIDYAIEKREESQAEQLGSINLVASYTHFSLPRTLAPLTPITMRDPIAAANVSTTQNLFGTGVAYSVPLFTGFAQTRQIEMDLISTQLAQSKSTLTKEQLVYNISSLYLSVLALKEMYSAQQNYVGTLKKLEQQISDEVKFGKKAEIDLLKAQSDLQGNSSYLEILKGNIVITKASLASLVGMDHIGTMKHIKVSVTQPNYSTGRLLADSSGLDRVLITDLNLKKAGKGVEKSRAGKLPQIFLDSYYGYNYGPNDDSNPRSGVWEDQNSWQIGLSVKWALFDFGKNDAVTQKAKIGRIEAELEKQQTMLDLRKSLIEAQEKIKQEYANYQNNLKQLALAKKSEKIESVRYLNDAATLNDLLYAKSKTHLAAAKLIESRYNYQKGKFYMDYLLERGVER